MKKLLALIIPGIMALAACDPEEPERPSGPTYTQCAEIGSYTCSGHTVYLCRFQGGDRFWQPRWDCGASSTPGCTCTVVEGLGTCSSPTSGYCEGRALF